MPSQQDQAGAGQRRWGAGRAEPISFPAATHLVNHRHGRWTGWCQPGAWLFPLTSSRRICAGTANPNFAPDDFCDLNAFNADLMGLFDELGWERAVVAGHDLGGTIAIDMANRHPDQVNVGDHIEQRCAIAFPDAVGPFWVKGAGHFMPWERPEMVNRAISSFCGDLLTP